MESNFAQQMKEEARRWEWQLLVYIFIKNWPVLKYRMLKYLATAGVNNNAMSEIAPMSLASTGNL